MALRSLLVLAGSATRVRAFFYGVQAPGADRFMQRVGRHAAGAAHLGHAVALVQQRLHPLAQRGGEHRGPAPPRRAKESGRALLAVQLAITFHGDRRHAERPDDVAGPHGSLLEQLAGEQPEAFQVVLGVGKDRQMAVEVDDLAVLALYGEVVGEGSQPGGEQGQLQLRHGPVWSWPGPRCNSRLGVPAGPRAAKMGRVIFHDPPNSPVEIRSSESRRGKLRACATIIALRSSACATVILL